MTVVISTFTLVAAVLAAMYAFPAYADWARESRRRPSVKLWLAVGLDDPDSLPEVVTKENERREIEAQSFVVRVAVDNRKGSASLRNATLNIMVPASCAIRSKDDPGKGHYVAEYPAESDHLGTKENPQAARYSVVERDFGPGHGHLYHLKITPPAAAGLCPVVATLSGEGLPDDARGELVARVTVDRKKAS